MGLAWHRFAPVLGVVLAAGVPLGACSRTDLELDDAAGGRSADDPGRGMAACQGELWSSRPPRDVNATRSRVLLVFDRSGSMDDVWSGQPRFQAAADAVRQALSPLSDSLTLGALFFPSTAPTEEMECIDPTGISCIFVPELLGPGGSCEVSPIDSEDQLSFMPGGEFLAALDRDSPPVYAPVSGGLTPLGEALVLADEVLATRGGEATTTVVVITDGAPNCDWVQTQPYEQVAAWTADGIRTHVLGLPGIGDSAAAVLDQLAAAGATGAFIPADEPEALAGALQAAVVADARFDSCELSVDAPLPGSAEGLGLVVRIAGRDYLARPQSDGDDHPDYSLLPGRTLTLHGALCVAATNGDVERLRLVQGCGGLPWLAL